MTKFPNAPRGLLLGLCWLLFLLGQAQSTDRHLKGTVKAPDGSALAGATVCIPAAGWLEGGLGGSFGQLVTDIEAVQSIAELCAATPGDDDAIGFEAIAEVQPGGHFFSAGHTMARYRTAFYEPLVADWSNFGNWTQSGSKTATERATGIWKRILADFEPPASAAATAGVLDEFIARRTEEGGAAPVS